MTSFQKSALLPRGQKEVVYLPFPCTARTNLFVLIVSSLYLLDGGWMTSMHKVYSVKFLFL